MSSILPKYEFFMYLHDMADEMRKNNDFFPLMALNVAIDLWDSISKGVAEQEAYEKFRDIMISHAGNEKIDADERRGYADVVEALDGVGIDFSSC